jgi:hypothetical protein
MTTDFIITADTPEEMREAVVRYFEDEMERLERQRTSLPPTTKKEEMVMIAKEQMVLNNRNFFRDVTIVSSYDKM